jgi:hypothetical protein
MSRAPMHSPRRAHGRLPAPATSRTDVDDGDHPRRYLHKDGDRVRGLRREEIRGGQREEVERDSSHGCDERRMAGPTSDGSVFFYGGERNEQGSLLCSSER